MMNKKQSLGGLICGWLGVLSGTGTVPRAHRGQPIAEIVLPPDSHPAVDFAAHPEYYPLRDGRRSRPSETRGGTQLCFTLRELQRVFIEEIDENDKSSRPTQFFRWLNPIARHLHDTYGKEVLTVANFSRSRRRIAGWNPTFRFLFAR